MKKRGKHSRDVCGRRDQPQKRPAGIGVEVSDTQHAQRLAESVRQRREELELDRREEEEYATRQAYRDSLEGEPARYSERAELLRHDRPEPMPLDERIGNRYEGILGPPSYRVLERFRSGRGVKRWRMKTFWYSREQALSTQELPTGEPMGRKATLASMAAVAKDPANLARLALLDRNRERRG